MKRRMNDIEGFTFTGIVELCEKNGAKNTLWA